MTTTEIKHLLETHNIAPLDSLSQNFFIDRPLLDKMLTKAGIEARDTIVEIGPGLGSLTQALLERDCPVIAFEIDRTLAQILPEVLGNPDNLIVHHQDIMEARDQIAEVPAPYKVVANIPYHITGGIIRVLLTQANRPESITLLIQQEVARKLTSDSSTYSLQRLSVEIYAYPQYLLTVPKGCFYPRPKVDSAVIQLTPHTLFDHVDKEAVVQFAKSAFQYKRKQARSTLLKHSGFSEEALNQAFDTLDLPRDVRPEQISLGQWVELYTELQG